MAECIRLQIPVCGMYVYVWVLYSTFKRVIHPKYRQIHAIYQSILHVSCMYLMIFGVCMCVYVYVCCAYNKVFCYIACICLYFLQPNPLVGRYGTHTGNTYIYMQIKQRYIQNTCKNTCKYMQIHTIQTSAQKCIYWLLSAIFACICMYEWYMCATCKVNKSIHMCMYCMYVLTCVYMLLPL